MRSKETRRNHEIRSASGVGCSPAASSRSSTKRSISPRHHERSRGTGTDGRATGRNDQCSAPGTALAGVDRPGSAAQRTGRQRSHVRLVAQSRMSMSDHVVSDTLVLTSLRTVGRGRSHHQTASRNRCQCYNRPSQEAPPPAPRINLVQVRTRFPPHNCFPLSQSLLAPMQHEKGSCKSRNIPISRARLNLDICLEKNTLTMVRPSAWAVRS